MSDFVFEIDFRLQRLWADSLFSLMVPSHLLFVFLAFIFSSFKCECQEFPVLNLLTALVVPTLTHRGPNFNLAVLLDFVSKHLFMK